jgi:BolA protein
VVSEQFAGMTPIKRHRLVNSILQKEFDDGLHALQLSTKTPAEWDKANKK